MGVNKKTDGRYIVGMGAPNENEYKGSQGWRDIFIQLTENGATPDSEEKLAFLRDYAIYHNSEGNAIMPPSVSVWVSNNGVTSAVNADDISLDGDTYTICGIKWDGSAWDYTNAGQSSGGGGSSLPSYTSADVGKVLTISEADPVETEVVVVPEQSVTFTNEGRPETPQYIGVLTGVNLASLSDGDTVTVYVNGTAYTEHYTPTESYPIGGDVKIYRRNSDNEWVAELSYDGATTGTYTISATAVTSVTPTVQTVIVPEQTVTLSEENPVAVLTGADIAALQNVQVGDVATTVINGVTYLATAVKGPDDTVVYIISGIGAVIGYVPQFGGVVFALDSDEPNWGDYTIRMTAVIASPTVAWKNVPVPYGRVVIPVSYNSTTNRYYPDELIETVGGTPTVQEMADYMATFNNNTVYFTFNSDSQTKWLSIGQILSVASGLAYWVCAQDSTPIKIGVWSN